MLSRFALRAATVRALRGATWAGSRVMDSELAAIDDVAAEHPQPVIVVYTDDGTFKTGPHRGLAGANGMQSLVIEIAVTQRMTVEHQGEQVIVYDQTWTDAKMELTLDLIERQVLCALTDPNNVWGEMWRRFAVATGDRTSNRGNSVREGVRFSGRQIMIPVELPRDPVPGAKPSALWDDFRTLAATDPELAPALAMIDAALAGSQVEPDWTVLSRAYALTAGGADALMVR